MDTDYDEVSVEETLSRHRQILDRFCKDKKLNVVEVLEEVVSGKTFDLQNESDEQFTDMKFMFSRYGLKTINNRLVHGRNQPASDNTQAVPQFYKIIGLSIDLRPLT